MANLNCGKLLENVKKYGTHKKKKLKKALPTT